MAQHYVLLTPSASARELGFLVPPSDATKGRIPLSPRGEFFLPPLGDWKISPPLLCQELRRGLTLNRYKEPDAADITPAVRQPNRSKKEAESAPLDAQSEIDSIVLNAPVADVYAYCSLFEELPRFITSLRDVQKIDETHILGTLVSRSLVLKDKPSVPNLLDYKSFLRGEHVSEDDQGQHVWCGFIHLCENAAGSKSVFKKPYAWTCYRR